MSRFLTIFASLLLFLCSCNLYSQSAVVVAGGTMKSSTHSVSYTLGQVFYTTLEGEGGTVSQGVEQPHEVTTVTTDVEEQIISKVDFYPNPVKSSLTITLPNLISSTKSYRIVNIDGKTLLTDNINNLETNVNVSHLPNGVYMLYIEDDNRIIESIKLIKENQ